MSGIRVNEWLHNSGTGGIWQTSAGNVGIASSVPTTKLEVTGDAKVSGVTTAIAFIPSQGQLSHRNLIINGDFSVAQRGITTTTTGYQTVDRFSTSSGGTDEAITFAQHALTSSDTGPWEKGLRHSFHITNGNQTGGAGASDKVECFTKLEAQDVASSGWDYTSSSSYITLSFWVKSSVAQNFYGYVLSLDGTSQNYPFETGSLTADTWTKITKVIPGNSNLQFDNNNAEGLRIVWQPFMGTGSTGSLSLNTWAAFNASVRTPNQTSTWWTTNDATFELTGVQLEVGQQATPFEHRSYGDQLQRCLRYYEQMSSYGQTSGYFAVGYNESTTQCNYAILWKVEKRTTPGVTTNGDANFKSHNTGSSATLSNLSIQAITPISCRGEATSSSAVLTDGGAAVLASYDSDDAIIKIDAEL